MIATDIIPVTISDKAAREIINTLERKNIPEGYKLRVGVRGGMACGGGGINFILGFDKKKEGDVEYRHKNISVIMQKKDTLYLIGQEIDFYEGADARGFTFAKNNS